MRTIRDIDCKAIVVATCKSMSKYRYIIHWGKYLEYNAGVIQFTETISTGNIGIFITKMRELRDPKLVYGSDIDDIYDTFVKNNTPIFSRRNY